jgi:small subunit ribosomal protein S2
MKPYIQGVKQDTHIINLDKTINSLNRSYKALYEITKKGGKILFVGTKRQVSNSIKLNAIRSNSFYINQR